MFYLALHPMMALANTENSLIPKITSHCTMYTANILTVLSTAFGSVTFPTVIWLCILPSKTAIDLKLYSSVSLSVMGTAVGCDNHCQITVGYVIKPMTVNWQ